MILFFFAATSPSFVYPLSLHDALPIYISARQVRRWRFPGGENGRFPKDCGRVAADALRVHRINGVVFGSHIRSEEHTSELQSRFDLVCRLLLEKKNCRRGGGSATGSRR